MTQNNEREGFEKFINLEYPFHSLEMDGHRYIDDFFDGAWHGWQARAQSSISQNEQQEAVVFRWTKANRDICDECYQQYSEDEIKPHGEGWVSLYTSPPKQIPEGWKLVPIESDEQMKDEARAFLAGLELGVKTFESMSEHLRLSGAYLPDWFLTSKGHINKMAKSHYIYESMLNAAPTTSLTSETNTEVGE